MQVVYTTMVFLFTAGFAGGLYYAGHTLFASVEYDSQIETDDEQIVHSNGISASNGGEGAKATPPPPAWPLPLDRDAYDARLLDLIDYLPPATPATTSTSTPVAPVSDLVFSSSSNVTVQGAAWPPANPYPHGGALLPFNRIIAYYGNYFSTRMGILGEFDRATVLAQLASTSASYEAVDPDTPVVPAIHYIAMVAQADAGSDGMYRNVMPDEHIERAFSMAEEIDGIVFLDLQVGLSTIQRELPQFREYLTRPNAHLGIDPEFAMAPSGAAPGTVIGTYDAEDINFVIDWLSEIVREHQLPPKVLVVHRFTQNMVTNYQDIQPTPEVQVVMHMDGWGSKQLKRNTHARVIEPEPVQFAGLKIFYKNDLKPPSTGIFTPAEAIEMHPEPIYIQYQ
ncbi:MAG TPA: hypothetical protein VKP88_03120 [Candidatus Paceibacterota bacterium]|nr:hypothetical protein [Candidatus Paceibacterota bacterium]